MSSANNDSFTSSFSNSDSVCFPFPISLALHEIFDLNPSAIKGFISDVEGMMNDANSRDSVVRECLEKVGIDVSYADIPAAPDKSTRKDRQAIDRMMKSGITERDIERERESGYYYGRNSGFYLSAGYAGVALLLATSFPGGVDDGAAQPQQGLSTAEIEAFLERMDEISREEISVADILERAKAEAGIDASAVACESTYKFWNQDEKSADHRHPTESGSIIVDRAAVIYGGNRE